MDEKYKTALNVHLAQKNKTLKKFAEENDINVRTINALLNGNLKGVIEGSKTWCLRQKLIALADSKRNNYAEEGIQLFRQYAV
jgi:hypothetical protein